MTTDLVRPSELVFAEIEKFTAKLNIQPDPANLQDTPDKQAKYIPIGIIENQLREDFSGLVQYEVIAERRELNEYIVTARIRVFHPLLLQWLNYDGIGACVIMQDAKAALDTFNSTKKKNALGLNAPNAYSEAIKNAAKKIGKKYGADINRKFEDEYVPEILLSVTLEEVKPMLEKCDSLDDLQMLWDTYPELHTSTAFKLQFTHRKNQIKNGTAHI